MKLTFEDNQGKKLTVSFPQIDTLESELDVDLALDPMWEKIKLLITEQLGNCNA